MCGATEQMCCTLDREGASHALNSPRSVFISKQTYWSRSCHLIRANLVAWVPQLLHWRLSHQFKDRRWTGAISVGLFNVFNELLLLFFCLMSSRIYKLIAMQAATFIFLLFIQDVMFWRSNRKEEQSVQLLHSISITLLLHWAFRPEGFTDAPLPACWLLLGVHACLPHCFQRVYLFYCPSYPHGHVISYLISIWWAGNSKHAHISLA